MKNTSGGYGKLFYSFVAETDVPLGFKGFRLIAVDGSDIQIPTNLNDADSLIQTCEGRKPYNLLHLNALYDLQAHTYVDAIVQKSMLVVKWCSDKHG